MMKMITIKTAVIFNKYDVNKVWLISVIFEMLV